MKTMKRIISIVFLVGLVSFGLDVKAQDVRFSQFNMGPLHLNPAMSGIFDGSFRVTGIYRDQWSSVLGNFPYRSYSVSFDSRFYVFKEDYVSVGLYMLGDKAGHAGYSQMQGHLSASYQKRIGGNSRSSDGQFIVAGAQIGMGQHGIDFNQSTWSTQFNGDVYDPLAGSGEDFDDESLTYMNMNAGLLWYGVWDERQSMYFGASASHINAPKISFYDRNESLYMKTTIHGGGELPMGQFLSWGPAFMLMLQGPSFETNAGFHIRYYGRDWNEIALRAGIWGRVVGTEYSAVSMDALIASVGLELERFTLGLSYDINVSTLSTASQGRGSFEVALQYVHPMYSTGSVDCPKF